MKTATQTYPEVSADPFHVFHMAGSDFDVYVVPHNSTWETESVMPMPDFLINDILAALVVATDGKITMEQLETLASSSQEKLEPVDYEKNLEMVQAYMREHTIAELEPV
jgi:hypothetical protein